MKLWYVFLFVLMNFSVFAQFNLADLKKSDVDKISNELSANFSHTTLTPASSMGNIIGFQVGILAGKTSSESLEELSQSQDPSSELASIPHAGILAVLSIPMGITFEASFLPSLESENSEINNMTAALKWTFASVALFDFAVRAHMSSGELSYTDQIEGVNSEVTIEHSTVGAQLLASANLLFVQPYVGVGTISHNTSWGVNTTAELFDFTSASSASSSGNSTHLIAGAEFNLFLMRVGFEYSSLFDTDRVSAKIAFGF